MISVPRLALAAGLAFGSATLAVTAGLAHGGVIATPARMPILAQSPFLHVLSDGTRIHVYPPPAVRQAWAPFLARAHMNYHGGLVIDQSVPYNIFWQPTGTYMSPKYQPTIHLFDDDIGNTSMYDILVQYSDTNGNPLNMSTFGGQWVDTSPYARPMNDRAVRNEVIKAITTNGWPAGGIQPIFFVFTASKAPVGFAACAYHGNFTYQGQPVIYSIVPYQRDYGPHGCGTPSKVFPNDQDADLTIDTMWHEFGESVSDPVNAWYSNASGAEIGDVCETSYGPLRSDGSDVTLNNGGRFVTQELWSNRDNSCKQHE